jgi:hypothetical protein
MVFGGMPAFTQASIHDMASVPLVWLQPEKTHLFRMLMLRPDLQLFVTWETQAIMATLICDEPFDKDGCRGRRWLAPEELSRLMLDSSNSYPKDVISANLSISTPTLKTKWH